MSGRKVEFSGCHLGSDALIALSEYLGAVDAGSHCRKVQLQANDMDGKACEAMLNALTMHDEMIKIDISSNNIGLRGAIALGEFVQSQTSLRVLRVANNKLGDDATESVANGIAQSESLEIVDLCKNKVRIMIYYDICIIIIQHAQTW